MAIIETERTFRELEEALAWAFGVGKAVLPLAGAAAKIYEILTADTNRRLVQNVLINDAGRFLLGRPIGRLGHSSGR